jgi:NADH dehydrogenase (ubiquinone) 1 alpha subcomplex subunit 9
LKNLMDMDKTSIGQTYNLAGPKTYTNREFLQLVADTLADPNHSRMTVNVPKPIMQAIAYLTNRFIWWPTMDPDLIERKYVDEPSDRKIMLSANGGLTSDESWKALDIVPDTLEDNIAQYIKWMRSVFCFLAVSMLSAADVALPLSGLRTT